VADVSIAEAKAKLSEIVSRVELGSVQVITRRGKPVARIVPICHIGGNIDVDALRSFVQSQPDKNGDAGEFIRWLRDTDRY
jgi:prevent-host-death family protein